MLFFKLILFKFQIFKSKKSPSFDCDFIRARTKKIATTFKFYYIFQIKVDNNNKIIERERKKFKKIQEI